MSCARAPSTVGLIDQISQNILVNKFYEALKLARKLMAYEQGGNELCSQIRREHWRRIRKFIQ